MAKTFNTRIQCKIDTNQNWISQNPILLKGEIIIVITESGEEKLKIGDGITQYSSLPFVDDTIRNSVSVHVANTNNPHNVTVQQIGADPQGSADEALNQAKSYTDQMIGNINTILDAINGEII